MTDRHTHFRTDKGDSMEQIGLWDKLESSNENREKLWTKSRTFAGDVWFRFRHKPTSLLGLLLIALLLVFALLGPMFLEHDYSQQNLDYVNMGPTIQVTHAAGSSFYITSNMRLIEVAEDGTLLSPVPRLQDDFNSRTQTFDYNGTTLTIIEGNNGNAVAYQTLQVNGRYIRGYCLPDYASKATEGGAAVSNEAGAWSKEARDWAVSIGLIKGAGTLPDGSPDYQWKRQPTREELVEVLHRFAVHIGKV